MGTKIKMVLVKKGMNVVQLADLLETSPQNLYKKFKRDNFSEKELQEIAHVLGIQYEGIFTLEDGTKI
ncbi:helix-turn-helix transcriptional regulator [Lysinibacillus capsici]|uniref:helix-turn-helix transcriptional regulator n=1 Tax=Lysinibacillus capsici TaxID=2115968 RepID=UPI000E1FF49B|nr:helix-turn-helix transcriptional regulator [Lysinibacillus capsici]RDV27672.1 transcriptional regulator [Lysinibacillus capsici]